MKIKKKNTARKLFLHPQVILFAILSAFTLVASLIRLQNRASVSETPHAAACVVNLNVPAATCQQLCKENADCISPLGCNSGKCVNPNNVTQPQCQNSSQLVLTINFYNPSTTVTNVKDITVNQMPFVINNGTILSAVTLNSKETKSYTANYAIGSQPSFTDVNITSGQLQMSGSIKNPTTGANLITIQFGKTLSPGKYRINVNGTVTPL